MTRKEFNEKFIANLHNVDATRLLIATKVRKYDFESATSFEDITDILIAKFNDDSSSWCVNEVAHEYEKIKDFTPSNLQIWENYRTFGNASEPIAKTNGDFLVVSFKGIEVNIDGQLFSVTTNDYITVPANHYSENGEYVTINYATMEKLLQIRNHLYDIARLVN